MRVTIEHTKRKLGLFKTAPAIEVQVEFTATEMEIIKRSGLDSYELYSPPIHSHYAEHMQIPVKVKDFFKSKVHIYFEDLASARMNEPDIRQSLKNLKDAIDANANPSSGKDTFEL